MKVFVLGAGVLGVTTAYFLARKGFEVTVLERQPAPAEECSYANGGQLSYTHVEPWASASLLPKLPQWLLDPDSPLVFHPRFDLAMWKWATKFLLLCNNRAAEESTKRMFKLARFSQEKMTEIRDHTDISFFFNDKGTLHVFHSEKSLQHFAKQSEFQKTLGCESIILSAEECLKKEPALTHAPKRPKGGVFFPLDETGDIHKFTTNLAEWLSTHHAVSFRYNCKIDALEADGNRISKIHVTQAEPGKEPTSEALSADKIVLSLGAYSPLLLNPLNINVPIYPLKGYSLTIPITNSEAAPRISITDQGNKIVYSRLGDALRVAGTAEFAGYNHDVTARRIRTLKKMVCELFPDAGNLQHAREWACLRPSTPDGSPIIGKTPYNNLYLNTGHGTLGWTLAAGSAAAVADLIVGEAAPVDLSGLTLEKYL
jgi:D-amino-acid dehydrogenase